MNKYIKSAVIVVLMIISLSLYSQNHKTVFVHKAVMKALDNNTRTNKGVAGENYWQNFCNYEIDAEILTEELLINGKETLTYFNNSPDTLKHLYFTNPQDLFKKGVQRDWDMGQTDLHDGIKIHSVIIDGKEIDLNPNSRRAYHRSTNFIVILSNYFAPKSEHKIIIEWTNIIPAKIAVRNGVYNKTNMMIGYWFPKVKVYDDIYGWAKVPHTGAAEYYHEFGDYKVNITTPKDYKLWATGVLQNSKEIYTDQILNRIDKASKSDKVINIVTKDEVNEVLKNDTKNVWKLEAKMVPDFAFAISKDYIWDATSINVDGKRVNVNAVYKHNSKDFALVADITRNIIDFYSNKNPGIKYPYPQMTAFNGGGGMEYPAMVNDGDSKDQSSTLYLAAHEVGHTYFPFNTGLNEQSYAWMDEGLITYFPRKFVKEYTNNKDYSVHSSIISAYNKMAITDKEIPLMVPSYNTGRAYRYQAYYKSSMAFYVLCEYLGEDVFNKSLQTFAKKWEHKHPSPYDFFNTFEAVSGQDLSWFWNPWFFEMKYADLEIGKLKSNKLLIKNIGGLPVAIRLEIFDGESSIKIDVKADVWKESNEYFVNIPKSYKLKKAVLNIKDTPDVFPKNNTIEFK